MKRLKIAQAFMIMLAITCVVFGSSMTVSATTVGEPETAAEGAVVEESAEAVSELEAVEIEENLEATEAASGTWYGLEWSISDGTLSITGSGAMQDENLMGRYPYPWNSYSSSVTKVIVGDFVTSIGDLAFEDMSNIVSVKIGSRVKTIGSCAFSGCTNLKSVTVPASVTVIESYAFRDCNNLETVSFASNSKLTTIEEYAFYNADSLKRIAFPASVKTIEIYAFYDCDSLMTVTFEEGIETIGQWSFYSTAIQSVDIPNTVKLVGYYAFRDCTMLESVNLGTGLTAISEGLFEGCTGLTSVVMGNNINTIYSSAFYECTKLKDITWSTNLNTIGSRAFEDCDALTSIKLPNSLKEIGGAAFYSCDSLKEVMLGESVNSIGRNAFGATPVSKFEIQSGNASIDSGAFGDKSILIIYGWPNSTAQTYANSNNIAFRSISTLAVPTHRKIVNVVSGVHVYWNEVLGAATYNVYRATSKTGSYTLVKKGVAASHYIDTTAVSGKTYYYKVEAVRGSVKSQLSGPSTGIIFVGTPDITSRINKGAGIQLGWNKISGATGYAIYRKPYNGSTWTRVTTIEGNGTFTWTDESVKANNGTVYKYTIRALAGSNMKTLSGCRNTGRTMVRLASRTLSSATKASSTSIKCSWTTSSAVTGYEVRFMVGDTVYKTVTIGNYKTGVKTFKDLKAGQTYKVQVRSYKKVAGVGSFYSAWSTAKYVKL